MLGSCPSLLSHKSQSSIRHKVRKLRAKVRTLIPEDKCQHYEKRNMKIERFMKRKPIQCKTACQSRSSFKKDLKKQIFGWKFSTNKFQQWFTEPQSQIILKNSKITNQRYQFHKLSSDQIEQINQDKIYYLGQDNIQAYNNFLKTYFLKEKQIGLNSQLIKKMQYSQQKPHSIQNKAANCFFKQEKSELLQHSKENKQIRQKTFFSFTMQSTPFNKKSERQPNRKNSNISMQKFNFQSAKNLRPQKNQFSNQSRGNSEHKPRRVYDAFYNNKTLEQRKQELQEDQKKWKMQHKARMEIQMAKAEANQRQLKSINFQKMKASQNVYKEKHQQVLKKMNLLMKKGQIVSLDEELRDILIKRKNIKKN